MDGNTRVGSAGEGRHVEMGEEAPEWPCTAAIEAQQHACVATGEKQGRRKMQTEQGAGGWLGHLRAYPHDDCNLPPPSQPSPPPTTPTNAPTAPSVPPTSGCSGPPRTRWTYTSVPPGLSTRYTCRARDHTASGGNASGLSKALEPGLTQLAFALLVQASCVAKLTSMLPCRRAHLRCQLLRFPQLPHGAQKHHRVCAAARLRRQHALQRQCRRVMVATRGAAQERGGGGPGAGGRHGSAAGCHSCCALPGIVRIALAAACTGLPPPTHLHIFLHRLHRHLCLHAGLLPQACAWQGRGSRAGGDQQRQRACPSAASQPSGSLPLKPCPSNTHPPRPPSSQPPHPSSGRRRPR